MLPRIDPAPVTDPAPADWLRGRLEFGRSVRQWVPDSYEAYARVLHPASITRREGDGWSNREVSWSEIAAWSGKELRPTSNFMDLQSSADGVSWQDEASGTESNNEPYEGQLVRPQLDRLSDRLAVATSTPDALWMLVWTGFGVNALAALGHRELEVSASLTGSGRRYFLCRGSFENAGPGEEGPGLMEPPTFWWPEDRAWFVSTDIDEPCTIIGGPASLIDRIVADERLESFRADLEDPAPGDPLPAP